MIDQKIEEAMRSQSAPEGLQGQEVGKGIPGHTTAV